MLNATMNLTTAQVIPLGMYSLLIILLGLIGNFIVIYSSVRHNALKLDAVSLMFIQHLAVADILYIVVVVIPNFATYSAGRWVFGEVLCNFIAQLRIIPGIANSVLVLAITLHRVILFTCPFRAFSPQTAKIAAGCVWGGAALLTGSLAIYYKAGADFRPDIAMCITTLFETAKTAILVTTGFTLLLPLVLIAITNMIICFIAKKHSTGSKSGNNILLIGLLSGCFIFSWIPYIVKNIMREEYQELDILAYNCIAMNSFANPILYSLTNRRFRKYLMHNFKQARLQFQCRSNENSTDTVITFTTSNL